MTYAKQDADAEDDVAGPGNGVVDIYTFDGTLKRRVASGGVLNSPWGIAKAPQGFGNAGGDLLIGNFGNGRINAFDLNGGPVTRVGALLDDNGQRIEIDGLWALQFGNGTIGSHRRCCSPPGPTTSRTGSSAPSPTRTAGRGCRSSAGSRAAPRLGISDGDSAQHPESRFATTPRTVAGGPEYHALCPRWLRHQRHRVARQRERRASTAAIARSPARIASPARRAAAGSRCALARASSR